MARERGETQGDVEEISRAGDEGSMVELGPGDEACNGQATLAFFGLMCDPTRRRLSKVSKFVQSKREIKGHIMLPEL